MKNTFRKPSIFSFGNTLIERRASRILFLIGLGTSTQIFIGGYTAISELLLVLFLPINLFKNQNLFRRDGLMPFITLLFIWMAGVCFTDCYVHNSFPAWIRGMIPPVGILAALVAVYPQLKKSPDSFKWFLFGTAISGVISIFIFQPGTAVGSMSVQTGAKTAVEMRLEYKLFWVGQVMSWLGLPVEGWYMGLPSWISVALAMFMAIFNLFSGGRSAFAVMALSVVFLVLGGKTRERMRGIKKHLPLMMVGLLLFMPLVKFAYKEAATRGWMGEDERIKYYEQAEGKNIAQTLMAGRGEFFIALFAIKDHPFIGHGSFALDHDGYMLDFCERYGNIDDYKKLEESLKNRIRTIPAHSHIACFWLWAGIPGLLPWIYILVLLGSTLFKRLHVMPQYFGYFALVLPGVFWAIFFSPFGSRIGMGFLLAMCFLVKTMEKQQRRFAVAR